MCVMVPNFAGHQLDFTRWDRTPHELRNHAIGKDDFPTVGFMVAVNHRRQILFVEGYVMWGALGCIRMSSIHHTRVHLHTLYTVWEIYTVWERWCSGFKGNVNDMTQIQYCDSVTDLKYGNTLQDISYDLYDAAGVKTTAAHGCWYLCDNGFHKWRVLQVSTLEDGCEGGNFASLNAFCS